MNIKNLPKKARKRLMKLREEIDTVDRRIMQSLAKRFKVVDSIGKLKRDHDLPVIHKGRMKEMLRGRKDDSIQLKLDPGLIYEIFDLLHEASIAAQERIVKASGKRKVKR